MNEAGMTLLQAWNFGGPLMWVLAGISVIAFTISTYLLFAHRRGAICPRELVSDVLKCVTAGEDGEARRLCERKPVAFSAVALMALDMRREALAGRTPNVAESIETAGAHVAQRMMATVDYLSDLAAIAPLVGLLGTVLGMFQAFGGIASDVAANAKPMVLAQGVSQAIVTTIFGLAIAIPCLVAHAWFRRRAMRRIAELETLTQQIEGLL
ncbi:MAG: MotA/TolQ/ExbB proton channel family protein [Kiritimatiellae bacterium]|nr:MotA/TolQ/ExbB proton channel family protein [Kiritimatiellia bacterium]